MNAQELCVQKLIRKTKSVGSTYAYVLVLDLMRHKQNQRPQCGEQQRLNVKVCLF